MKLYEVKYIDTLKTRFLYVLANSYSEAELKISKEIKSLVLILNIKLLAHNDPYGKPSILIK